MRNSPWLPVLTFFACAFLITLGLRRLPAMACGGVDLRGILCGFGPLLGALICYKAFGAPNTFRISLGGANPALTAGLVAFVLLLPLALTHKPRGAFAVFVLTQTVYCFGEEFGWRHYLQNATARLNKWPASLLTGTAWFFWHYSWIDDPIRVLAGQGLPSGAGAAVCILALSLLSLMFRDLVIKTRSVLLPTVGHAVTKFGGPVFMLAVLLTLLAVQLLWGRTRLTRPDGPAEAA